MLLTMREDHVEESRNKRGRERGWEEQRERERESGAESLLSGEVDTGHHPLLQDHDLSQNEESDA